LSDSQDLTKAEQLKETGREWADSVQSLAAAVEKGSQPWGKPPSRLAAEAAKGGSQLEHEVRFLFSNYYSSMSPLDQVCQPSN